MEQLPSAFICSSHFWGRVRTGREGGESGDLATDSAGVTAGLGADRAFCFRRSGSPWEGGLWHGRHDQAKGKEREKERSRI